MSVPNSSPPSRSERDQILDDVYNIVRTTGISRGAAMSSTPEQIVHMVGEAIADNLRRYSLEGFDSGHDRHVWYPREVVLATVIKRELRSLRGLSEKSLAVIDKAIDRAVEEWPS